MVNSRNAQKGLLHLSEGHSTLITAVNFDLIHVSSQNEADDLHVSI